MQTYNAPFIVQLITYDWIWQITKYIDIVILLHGCFMSYAWFEANNVEFRRLYMYTICIWYAYRHLVSW